MFADISGFTRLSEQLAELGKAGAEELTVLLNGTFEALLGVARAEGGDLVKFGGDALFLFFEGDGHAMRACRAAAGMRATLKARGAVVTGRGRVVLRISMGVHSGPFMFVLAGDRQRELFVLGEHATTVTDMESTADAGEILVSRDTAAQLPASWLGAPKGEGVLLRRVGAADVVVDPTAVPAVDGELLAPFVPAAIRRRLDDGEHTAEHRRTTVAFVHIGGIDSTLRERGPEAVAALLHRAVTVAVDAAERFGVTLLATDVAGGGIKLIMTAGVPESVEDGEGRMMAVGRALVEADLGLPVRVGLNTGHVFAGEVGAPWRRVYTVMGDAVNLSARFMSKAAPGEVVASQATVEQSATPFVTTPLEPFMVKGKRHPQRASSVGPRIEGRDRQSLTDVSFIGREEEITQLVEAFHRAIDDRGQVVEIVGEPGIGKSRLVQELTARAEHVRVVRVTCEPFASDRPFFMARVLLRTGMKIPFDASPEDAGEMLLEWLERHAGEQAPFAPLIAAALDAVVPNTRAVDDIGAEFRAETLRSAASAVLHAAFAHPLLLVVEDAMWMDEASALLLARALSNIEDLPWFGCFTTRNPAEGLGSRLGYAATTMQLEALDERWSMDLASQLTDDALIPHQEVLELVARANGNPLFLLELAHARRELGSLDAIPGSLEDLIGARIDRLAPADRSLLRHAAVLGDRFSPKLFDRTLGDVFPPPQRWERLGDFVVQDQGELRFSHDLVRRVAYSGLPFRRRRELHLRIGTALIPRQGEPDVARLGLLALHFDGSGDHLQAWKYNRLAAARARDAYATVEATAFFERAIANAKAAGHDVDPQDLRTALEEYADVAVLAGRYDLARDGLRGARRAAEHDPLLYARLCRKEGHVRRMQSQYRPAVSWFRKAIRTLDQAEASGAAIEDVAAERARAMLGTCSTLVWHQKYRQMLKWLQQALQQAELASDRASEAHAYYLLDWALGELGDPQAEHYQRLAQPIYEELGDYTGLANVLNNLGVTAFGAGDWDACTRYMEDSLTARRRAGDVVGMAQCSHNLAEVLGEQGRFEDAELHLREARRVWRSSGFGIGVAAVTNTLGRVVAKAGRADEGIALLKEAQAKCRELQHGPFLAETEARLAEAFLFGGHVDEAIAALDELGERAGDGGPPVVALSLRIRGTCVARRGELEEARRLLEAARQEGATNGAEWEAALASVELARLAGTAPVERERLEREATAVFRRMGIDVTRVLPPQVVASP